MQYMLLIYDEPGTWENMAEGDQAAMMNEYFQYTDSLRDAGVLVSSAPLDETATATTVRVRDGKRLTTDGPFAETREVLGGYYVIECETLDEALGHAERVPSARFGSIEVRPVVQLPARTA